MIRPGPVRIVIGGLAAAMLGLLPPSAFAAEKGLGISGSSIIAHAVAAKAIEANDRETVFSQPLRKTVTVFGKKSSKCLRLFLIGDPDRPVAIVMRLRTVCAGGNKSEKNLDAIGRIIGELAPSLEQPAGWLLKQDGTKPKTLGNPKGTAWFQQFAGEKWHGYYARVFHLERVRDGKIFVFGGSPPGYITLTIEAAPRSKSPPKGALFPYPADKRLQLARDHFRRGDYRAATAIVQRLSDQGIPDAVAMLGDMYFYRRGAEQNFKRAEQAYRNSATAGSSIGQFGLGTLISARGPKHSSEAGRWFMRAAMQGHSLAQVHLAVVIILEKKTPNAATEAARWCAVSARLGNVMGQICAGDIWYKRTGVKKDAVRGYFWFSVAQSRIAGQFSSMYETLGMQRAVLAKSLTPAQRRAADRKVKTWKPMTFEQIKASCRRIQCPKELAR